MFDKGEMIDKLKQELEILEKGGYARSECAPHWAPRVFRDSVSCPNLGVDFKLEPCGNCYLTYFVPLEHRAKENPCHYIPLNEQGETIASLSEAGDNARLQSTLRLWLQKTIIRLAEEPEPAGPLATLGERSLIASVSART